MEVAMSERAGEAWADGNIRVGDYILLIDSDTRVPRDCLLEAVSEMEQCQDVAILQYSSGVMNVTDNFFEKGITFFTNMIYTMIRFAVAGGDVAPFVGHNAFLRWSALQRIGFKGEKDEYEKFWSEETVSEDFDMSLRLQSDGYIIRLAAYKGDGFKEGVSLTVYDELARWEKYACSIPTASPSTNIHVLGTHMAATSSSSTPSSTGSAGAPLPSYSGHLSRKTFFSRLS
jgi:membrane glycosyltransferase